MPPEPESALSAIDEALGLGPETEAEETALEGAEEAAEGLEDGEAEAAEGETAEGEAEGEQSDEDAEAEGKVRGPDGKFVKKAEEPAKPVEAKKPDPLNDPIPKELKAETQERIRTLIKTTKEATERVQNVERDFNFMVEGVRATGTTPDQYREVLSWMALFNSGDPNQQGQALEMVEQVADQLATLLGRERKSADPLAAHADLQRDVQAGKITPEYAKQIAVTRNSQSFRGQLHQNASQEQQAQQQLEQATAQARADLNAVEQSLKADPNYQRKKDLIVPALRPVFKNLHPSQWASAFQEAYNNVRLPAAVKKVPTSQPLRAGKSTPAGGGPTKGVGSAMDAMNLALGAMK